MPADRVRRSFIRALRPQDTEPTLVEDSYSDFPSRFDPISRRVLLKSRTESQIPNNTIGTRANFQLFSLHTSEPNVFSRAHALITHERKVERMKVDMKHSLVLAEKEARQFQFYERKLTREEMRKKDQQALLRIIYGAYVWKWEKFVFPDLIKAEEQEDVENDDNTNMDFLFPLEELIPYLRFADIPWPLFAAVHTLPQFLEKTKEIVPFLRHPDVHKYLEGIQKKDVWGIHRYIWNPKKFEARILRKIVKEDRDDVSKAYMRVKDVLWSEKKL